MERPFKRKRENSVLRTDEGIDRHINKVNE